MKQTLYTILLCAFIGASTTAQAPAKLFDTRNGNGIVDSGRTVPAATVVEYKDAASKQKVIDAFATAYGYQVTVPDPANPGQTIANPQSKQGFFNAQINKYLREVYKAQQTQAAANTATATAAASAEAELPPSQ